jgi:hypothetical protein
MNQRDAISIYCTFGGGGGDAASSTMPLHGHPETNFNRAKQRKGGPDKGGVTAGGQGSGCNGPNCGRKAGAKEDFRDATGAKVGDHKIMNGRPYVATVMPVKTGVDENGEDEYETRLRWHEPKTRGQIKESRDWRKSQGIK